MFSGRSGVFMGGLAALATLAGMGAVAAARSSSGAAVIGELVRFPFPRFRVLSCRAVDAARRLSALRLAAGPVARRASVSTHGVFQPPAAAPRVGGPSVTRGAIGRVGLAAAHASSLVKVFVLAMLMAANVVVVAVRRRIGRLSAR
jgi:hypothetical protein